MNQIQVKAGQIVRHDIDLDFPMESHVQDGAFLLIISCGVMLLLFLWRK